MGTTDIESARIDSICEYIRDFKTQYQKVRKLEGDDKVNGMNEWFNTTLVTNMTSLNEIVGTNNHSVGNELSLSDIVIYSFINEFFDDKESSIRSIHNCNNIINIINHVSQHPLLITYFTNRKQTVF